MTDYESWKELMIETGRMPDDNGYWHYPVCDITEYLEAEHDRG